MKLGVTKPDVWAASIADRPGGLAAKLAVLANSGANLEFVIARRERSKPGTGVVFVAPLSGAKQTGAAKKAGLKKATSMSPLRVSGPDKPGIGARLTAQLAQAGISLRGLSAASIGKKFVLYLSFDSAADSAKAARLLRQA